jgi:hypothetical protein
MSPQASTDYLAYFNCLERNLPHDSDDDLLARILVSLRNGVVRLKNYYGNLPTVVELVSPHYCSFEAGSDTFSLSEFKSLEEYFYPSVSKLVFFAKMNEKQNVFVKFVRNVRYPIEFHQFCAEKGFGPCLHGTKISPCGRWTMVVMEALDGFENAYNCRDPDTSITIQSRVTSFVIEMHLHGFVHGDLRTVNIMYRKKKKWRRRRCCHY